MTEAEAVLRAELDRGETLRWAGQPGALSVAKQELPLTVFLLLWTGGVGYAFSNALLGGWGWWPTLMAAFMLCLGLAGLGHSLLGLLGARRTLYGVTDRRILTVEQGMRRRVTSWTPQQITGVERRERGGGRGDIVFHQSHKPAGNGATTLVVASLVDVEDARAVEALVRELAAVGPSRALPPLA